MDLPITNAQGLRMIAVKLDTSGDVEYANNVPLYQGSYGFVGLRCLVPKTINNGATDGHYCVVTRKVIGEDGSWTNYPSDIAYNMPYVCTVTDNNVEYYVFECPMPKEFLEDLGDLQLTIAYVVASIVNDKTFATSVLKSKQITLQVKMGGGLIDRIVLEDTEATAAAANAAINSVNNFIGNVNVSVENFDPDAEANVSVVKNDGGSWTFKFENIKGAQGPQGEPGLLNGEIPLTAGTGDNSLMQTTATKASGKRSVALGSKTKAIGPNSYAEGSATEANAYNTHAGGVGSKAGFFKTNEDGTPATGGNGNGAFAHGQYVSVTGDAAAGFGEYTEANGFGSFVSGSHVRINAHYSDGAGQNNTIHKEAQGSSVKGANNEIFCAYSAVEGTGNKAGDSNLKDNIGIHVEGFQNKGKGTCSHAEGRNCESRGNYSHAGGFDSVSISPDSLAHGWGVVAQGYEGVAAIGRYNSYGASGDLLLVGNGVSANNRNTAFRVNFSGNAYLSGGSYNTSGADYAEYFEWADGNESSEDRVGYFVTLDELGKIKKAKSKDYILGIVSGTAGVIGNSHEEAWANKYMRDEWGRFLYETVYLPAEFDESGIEVLPARNENRRILNPLYNPNEEYIPRSKRKEWATIGMLGVLLVRDDGSCIPGCYCKPNDKGEATLSDCGYKVIGRITDKIVKIILK